MNRNICTVVLCVAASQLAFGQQPSQQPAQQKVATTGETVANKVTPQPVATSATIPEPDDRYRIGPGDVLDIRILNRPNLSRESVRVEGNGMIRMPLIDTEIQAACQTEGELAKEIASRYLKFYRNPQVDVFIKGYHSRQVAIIGAVNDQSRFELQRRVRLLELLTYAKGPSPRAGQTINVVHSPQAWACNKPGADEAASAFSSYKLSETLLGHPSANPYLEPGDIVTLPEADQAYVVGNVVSPLTIPLNEPITLSRAIAMAGGVRQDTKKDKIRVLRQEPGSATKKEIIVNLSAIEKKRAEDIALMPNDIVEVQTSEGKALLRSLVGGAGSSVSQLPIRVIP
ncbi:MAG: polysaccharide biosynthesis/export family protein [Terriglobia bacterium]